MIWIIILLVLLVIAVKFMFSLGKDSKELNDQHLEKKFEVLIKAINTKLFYDKGNVSVVDRRSLNLYSLDGSQLVQFFYSTGSLTLSWRARTSGSEIKYQNDYHHLRNASEAQQVRIAEDFLKEVSKQSNNPRGTAPSSLLQEEAKIKVNAVFYDFCFSAAMAQQILGDTEMRLHLIKALVMQPANDKILESLFRSFALAKHKLNLDRGDNVYYHYRGFKFDVYVSRFYVDDSNDYFEVLLNDFKKVKNSDGVKLARATEYILYVKENMPSAIFVVVHDPILKTYAIRRVYEDGASAKITFIEDKHDAITFLTDFISKK